MLTHGLVRVVLYGMFTVLQIRFCLLALAGGTRHGCAMISADPMSEAKAVKKFLIVSLLIVTNPACAEWVQVYENDEARFYVDPATIRKDPGVRRASDLKDLKKPDRDGTKSRLAQREYECKAGRSRILSLSTFSATMAGGKTLSNTDDPSAWVDIPANTAYAAILKKVCTR